GRRRCHRPAATSPLTSRSFSFILNAELSPLMPELSGSQPLTGHLVVFTGKLSSLGRKDARALVARLGGATAEEVSAKTTMLVIGEEGVTSEAQSNKLRPGQGTEAA